MGVVSGGACAERRMCRHLVAPSCENQFFSDSRGTELALHFYKKSNKELIAKLDQDIADIKKAESDVTKLPTGKLVRDAIEARIR